MHLNEIWLSLHQSPWMNRLWYSHMVLLFDWWNKEAYSCTTWEQDCFNAWHEWREKVRDVPQLETPSASPPPKGIDWCSSSAASLFSPTVFSFHGFLKRVRGELTASVWSVWLKSLEVCVCEWEREPHVISQLLLSWIVISVGGRQKLAVFLHYLLARWVP